MKLSPARTAAFDILLRIERERAYSSVLLPIFEAGLSPVDRGLCHQLTLGTLRRQIYLDRIIDDFSGGKKIDIEIRITLRLGLFQLIYLDKIPQYSAINESVNLVQRAKKTSAKGFVNAILRRGSREKISVLYADKIDRIVVETSHPRWLIEKWIQAMGFDGAAEFAFSNNEIPNTAFRFLGDISAEGHALLSTARQSENVDGCFVLEKFDERIFALADRGEIYIQDEASQMAARSVKRPENMRVLDVCASPGGKTGLIAGDIKLADRMVVAGDLYWPRVEYLRDNCRHQGADFVDIVQYDAAQGLPFADESFDSVLLDSPCSGTGTIRHNPELRYHIVIGDFDELPTKQLSMLNQASKLVRRGGEIIYSTCSVEPEENEEVCRRFISESANFKIIRPQVASNYITADGFARTWPGRDDMDGFFIAAFQRN